MAKFNITQEYALTLTIAVEAEDSDEAVEIVMDAMHENEAFQEKFWKLADIMGDETYEDRNKEATVTFDEMCEED